MDTRYSLAFLAGPVIREEGINTAPQRHIQREDSQRKPVTTRYVARSQADVRAAIAQEGDVRVTGRDAVLTSDETRDGSEYSAGQVRSFPRSASQRNASSQSFLSSVGSLHFVCPKLQPI